MHRRTPARTVHVGHMTTLNSQPTSLSEFENLLRSMSLEQLPDLLTIRELSIWARIPVNTLYEWRAKGIGPTPMKMGKHLRYSKERVRAWQRDLESQVA